MRCCAAAVLAATVEIHVGARDRGTHAHTARDDQDREHEPRSFERAQHSSFPVHGSLFPLSTFLLS
jgi:hypothetical protein